jgi:hypothetical protein
MRVLRLPNGNLLIPVEAQDPDAGLGLLEIGRDHPEYGRFLVWAEDGEDPRPRQRGHLASHQENRALNLTAAAGETLNPERTSRRLGQLHPWLAPPLSATLSKST